MFLKGVCPNFEPNRWHSFEAQQRVTFVALKMSEFPKKQHLREILLHYFILKKSAAETHRLLVDIYGEHAPSKTSCTE